MDKVFMVLNSVNWVGGTNMAVMDRSRKIAERKYEVSILTLRDFNIEEVENKLREMGKLVEKVQLMNIYNDYKERNTRTGTTSTQKKYYKKSNSLYESGFKVQIDEQHRFARYFNNGIYIKNKRWDEDGRLSYINYFSESRKRVAREEFHPNGYVTKKTYYDPADEQPMYLQHFTIDGFCYLNIWYTQSNKKSYFLFDRNTQEVKLFKNESDFCTHWLNLLCLEQSQKPYIICDKQNLAPSVKNVKENMAHKIYTFHSNHLKHPYKAGSPVKSKTTKWVLENLKELDRVVMLTEKQKQDVIEEFNDYDNICVIPHSIRDIYNMSNKESWKDNKTISMVSRLVPIKQIDQAIEAFQQVIQKIPDAKLEIYGSGELEGELKKKIMELKLNQNVFLRGYTSDTDLIYKRSLFTLLTSKSEGFSLAILESMANGTPVISYDVNYGPSDIITNGEDGYLIKEDKQILTDKMIELLRDPKRAHEMGKKAKENVSRKFSEQKIIDKWVKLFNDLRSSKP